MKRSATKLAALLGLVVLMGIGSGCDLISPPKKAASKPVDVKPLEEQPETPAVATTTSTDIQGPLPADVIVRVGSWSMTADDFNERLRLLKQSVPDFNDKDTQSKITVLNELVRQQLLVKEAESSDVGQTKDIKDAVEDFRRTLLVQELAQRITKGIEASADDVQKYYDSNKNLFIKWKVRQIVVEDEATAKNLLVQILQGGDFAALAKAQSKDKTAPDGGLIADPSQAPLEIQKNILALEAGGTSAAFKGPQGYYLVHVDEKNLVPLAEVKDQLKSNLTLRKQQEAIIEHIKTLEQKTKIEINNELLGTKDVKKP